ncbi:MAG: JAB domain-containing protein [Bacteroidales bacterium]|nr:JAB domain-containing protein [Bacteroidales bacterium]
MKNICSVSEVKLSYKSKLKASERPKVTHSESVYKLLLNCFESDTIEFREYFKVLLLNRSNQVLGVFNVSEGGISETVVDIRLIMQSAILSNASGIILCHNHPSGNLTASRPDEIITNNIKKACDIMGISLLDHIIVTSESYYSFADNGKL